MNNRRKARIHKLIEEFREWVYEKSLAAEKELVKIGADAVEPLIYALNHAEPELDVRRGAAMALGKIKDPRAVPSLIASLGSAYSLLRDEAAEALGAIGDPRALAPLIKTLKLDEDESVRSAAASALGDLKDPRAIPHLGRALRHPNICIRYEAAISLGKIGDTKAIPHLVRVFPQSTYEGGDVSEKVEESLVKFGEPAVVPLMKLFARGAVPVKIKIVEVLGKIGAAALPALIAVLKDRNCDMRELAAEVLGKIRDEGAVPALILTLKDKKVDVRLKAAKALGKIGDVTAVEPLIALLKDEDPDVQDNAAKALGRIGVKVLPALFAAAGKHPDLREELQKLTSKIAKKSKRPSGVRMVDPRPSDFHDAVRSRALVVGARQMVRLGR